MNVQGTEQNASNIHEWLQLNHDFIEELKQQPLTKQHTKAFYTRLTRANIFGPKIIIRISDQRILERGKIQIKAHILEPTENGLITCKSPIHAQQNWEITGLVHRDSVIKSGELYESSYTFETHEHNIFRLLKITSNQLTPLNLSLKELLLASCGKTLTVATEKKFGTDLESILLSRLAEYRNSLFEDEFLRIKHDQLQLEAQQKENAELRNQLAKEKKELHHVINQLKKNHQTEKTALNIRHQKEISQLTDREFNLYKIISELRKQPNPTQSTETDKPILPWESDTVVNTLQHLFYCDRHEKLYYHTSVIDSFLRALQTNALIILSGPSGTGKSSLVTAFADAIQNAVASSIPVQSSWTDKQDLFGYFNSIEKCFVPTEFLEKLMEAKTSTGLHLISLDEMNLSHVEYYFAEILSSREQNKAIQLYPQRYYDEAEEVVSDYECIEDPTPIQINQYRNAKELLKYHYQIVIPDNVRFIGTINMDHTVKPLSPKVIDRSFVIELTHQTPTIEEKATLDASTQTGRIEYHHQRFMTPGLPPEAVEPDVEWIIECSADFHTVPDVRINARGMKQLTAYLQSGPAISEQTIDYVIMSKLLPRIHFSTNQHPEALDTFKIFIDKLYTKGFHASATRANAMLQSNRYIKFFD